MRVVMSGGAESVATVYLAEMGKCKWVEFVESVQRPIPLAKKWVLIVSTLFGCPVKCLICDAGSHYRGRLSAEQIFSQIDYLIKGRFPDGIVPVEKFKIQFARLGEPTFNPAVLEVLRELPRRYTAPGLVASLSTIAPEKAEKFLHELVAIKDRYYSAGRFQLQFSVHTTDERLRDRIMPVKKWSLEKISRYGEKFVRSGDKKVTLNFALIRGIPLAAEVLKRFFDPAKFLVKITPVNPTYAALAHDLFAPADPADDDKNEAVFQDLRRCGFEVINSIGDREENQIGSNCGQSLIRHLSQAKPMREGYNYPLSPSEPADRER